MKEIIWEMMRMLRVSSDFWRDLEIVENELVKYSWPSSD